MIDVKRCWKGIITAVIIVMMIAMVDG